MAAHAYHAFTKGFELDEERLRKIYSLIKVRITSEIELKNTDVIQFKVIREDSLIFGTDSIEIVLSEDNDSTQKISEINIDYKDPSFDVSVAFSSKNGCMFNIAGSDRDKVFLLKSDLKEYIGKEVANLKNFSLFNRNITPIFFGFIIIIFSFLVMRDNYNVSTAVIKSQALSSNDLSLKLNYIIENINKMNVNSYSYIAPVMIIFSLFTFGIVFPWKKIYSFFFPRNIFLIGKQISIIKNKRKLNANIFWCVIVALVVGLLLGFLFLHLSK